MSDFFDRLERQLNRKTRELAREQSRRSRRRRPGLLAFALVGLVGAGTAVAATGVWRPLFGEARFHPGPGPSVSASPPPKGQLAVLGVLRHAQTPADRSAAVRRQLLFVGGVSGVRTDYIRKLETNSYGAAVILVPAAHYKPKLKRAPAAVRAKLAKTNVLCVIYPEATLKEGAGVGCYSTHQVLAGQATASVGDHIYGLVPDGVTRVTITYKSGRTVSNTVRQNFFDITMLRHVGESVSTTWHYQNGHTTTYRK